MARHRSEALPQPRPYRPAHPRRLGLAPIDAARARDLLEILDDRFGRRSAIVTSQLLVAGWHRQLKDPSMADAILDRLVHSWRHTLRSARHLHALRGRWRWSQTMKAGGGPLEQRQ